MRAVLNAKSLMLRVHLGPAPEAAGEGGRTSLLHGEGPPPDVHLQPLAGQTHALEGLQQPRHAVHGGDPVLGHRDHPTALLRQRDGRGVRPRVHQRDVVRGVAQDQQLGRKTSGGACAHDDNPDGAARRGRLWRLHSKGGFTRGPALRQEDKRESQVLALDETGLSDALKLVQGLRSCTAQHVAKPELPGLHPDPSATDVQICACLEDH